MRKPVRRKPAARPVRGASSRPVVVEAEIAAIGARGDGVAQIGGEALFVPYTVPGDRVIARVEGKRGDGLAGSLVELVSPGPARAEPACGHFGTCGGCALQHVAPEAYAAWKRDLLVQALSRAGLDVPVAPLVQVPPGTRRRATFAYRRLKHGAVLGFNARGSHTIVDVVSCALLDPVLVALMPPLRAILAEVAGEGEGDVIVTRGEQGVDVLIEGEARLDLFERERLAQFAEAHDLARLSWRRPGAGFIDPLAARRTPLVSFAGVAVEPAPGGFLQPSVEGERALAELVVAAVGKAGPVADLFAGCGSFTFPLAAAGLAVHAVEGDEPAVTALKAAADRAQAIKVTAERRDLSSRPLMAAELKKYAAVVFDPPRAGAAAQAEHLAAAGPALVVAVSCNPATLARDARTLVDGGCRLELATPVDQFPWTAHLEAVAVFRR